jgi:hypothetical protein
MRNTIPVQKLAEYLAIYKMYLQENNLEDDSDTITASSLTLFIEHTMNNEEREHLQAELYDIRNNRFNYVNWRDNYLFSTLN